MEKKEYINLIIKEYKEDDTYAHFKNSLLIGTKSTQKDTDARVFSRNNSSGFSSEKSKENSVNRTRSMIYDLAIMNNWEWFVTFTFDGDLVNRYDYDAITKKFSQWLKNIKKTHAPSMKYIVVPERHKDGAYHFHGLLSQIEALEIIEGEGKKTRGKVVHNVNNYKLGFSTATKVESSTRVARYITKYITKDLMQTTKNRKRFWSSRNLEKPKVTKMYIEQEDMDGFIESKRNQINWYKHIVIDDGSYQNEINIYNIRNDAEESEKDKKLSSVTFT